MEKQELYRRFDSEDYLLSGGGRGENGITSKAYGLPKVYKDWISKLCFKH